MAAAAQSRLARFFRDRPWIRLANSTVLGVLVFVMSYGRGGVLGVLGWLALGMSVLCALVLVGVLAARSK